MLKNVKVRPKTPYYFKDNNFDDEEGKDQETLRKKRLAEIEQADKKRRAIILL
jgi:hypothetical protein